MHKLLPSAATRIPPSGDKTSPYKRRNSKPGEGSLVGLGGSPSIRMRTHWEGLEGKSLQPEELSGGARYKYHSEVGLAIKAGCTSPHLSCWGGKTQHISSVMCFFFFFCLASKRSNKQWRACRAAWSWVSVPRVAVAGSRLQPFAALAVQVLSVPLHWCTVRHRLLFGSEDSGSVHCRFRICFHLNHVTDISDAGFGTTSGGAFGTSAFGSNNNTGGLFGSTQTKPGIAAVLQL